jgi:hypothetical protein
MVSPPIHSGILINNPEFAASAVPVNRTTTAATKTTLKAGFNLVFSGNDSNVIFIVGSGCDSACVK